LLSIYTAAARFNPAIFSGRSRSVAVDESISSFSYRSVVFGDEGGDGADVVGLDEELIEVLADPDYVVAKVCAFGQEPLAADQVALRVAESHSQAGSRACVATAKALVDAGYLKHPLPPP
jgi:hypothetical protein